LEIWASLPAMRRRYQPCVQIKFLALMTVETNVITVQTGNQRDAQSYGACRAVGNCDYNRTYTKLLGSLT